jgi:hypothetical protein
VYRLKKVLYGLKQEPCAWYSRIDEYLLGLGFTKTYKDPIIHYSFDGSDLLVLVMYVDDLILKRSTKKLRARCTAKLAPEFKMKEHLSSR